MCIVDDFILFIAMNVFVHLYVLYLCLFRCWKHSCHYRTWKIGDAGHMPVSFINAPLQSVAPTQFKQNNQQQNNNQNISKNKQDKPHKQSNTKTNQSTISSQLPDELVWKSSNDSSIPRLRVNDANGNEVFYSLTAESKQNDDDANKK